MIPALLTWENSDDCGSSYNAQCLSCKKYLHDIAFFRFCPLCGTEISFYILRDEAGRKSFRDQYRCSRRLNPNKYIIQRRSWLFYADDEPEWEDVSWQGVLYDRPLAIDRWHEVLDNAEGEPWRSDYRMLFNDRVVLKRSFPGTEYRRATP